MSVPAYGDVARLTLKLDEVTAERDHYRRELGLIRDQGRVAVLQLRLGLSPTEAAFLDRLAKAGGAPVHNEQLLSSVWGERLEPVCEAVINVYVFKIRQKIGSNTIGNVHSHGYFLTDIGRRVVADVFQPASEAA